MKSIGEISIAPPYAGFREFSSRIERKERQPQQAQHRDPKGEPGPTAAAQVLRLDPPGPRSDRCKRMRRLLLVSRDVGVTRMGARPLRGLRERSE